MKVSLVHSQWIHSCGTIGMYGAWLLGVPFSFTGHAADLFRERAALRDKIRRASFIVCISSFHRDFYLDEGARPEQLHTVYCGIDVDRFTFEPRAAMPARPLLLSVGRLVEKKGFDVLIEAARVLAARGRDVEIEIGGSGPLDAELREQISAAGVESSVRVTGAAILQEDLPAYLQRGDAFVQPCVRARDQDVDGTPRTLMEAMACGLPSISTRLAGIPDIIDDGASGLLVEPHDAEGLADAIERLLDEPALVDHLSRGGRARIEDRFEIEQCTASLADLFRTYLEDDGARVETSTPALAVGS